jgi:biotin carboxyl carrier protein
MEKKLRITVDGRQYDVTVEDLSEGTSYTIPSPGDMSVAASQPAAPAAPSSEPAPAATTGPGDEVSPLAGVVVSIETIIGQEVKEGDKLMTLEAMKMKTAVIAHHNGKVTNIAVKVGDPVDAGQVLLTIA